MTESAFTRVFDALCGVGGSGHAGCLRSVPKGEAVFSQGGGAAKGGGGEGTNGFDAVESAHMSKGNSKGEPPKSAFTAVFDALWRDVCGHGYSHGNLTVCPGISPFPVEGIAVCSQYGVNSSGRLFIRFSYMLTLRAGTTSRRPACAAVLIDG